MSRPGRGQRDRRARTQPFGALQNGQPAFAQGGSRALDAAGGEKEFRSYLDQVEVLKALGRSPLPNA